MTEKAKAESTKKVTNSMPQWESKARDRIKAAIRKFNKPLSEMESRDANETDTRLLVTDFLCDGLGFDKYEDLDTEYRVKNDFADYGIRIDEDLTAFVEVKRVKTKLGPKHLRQVEMYAVNEGVEWVVLTNAAQWQAYHITGGLPVQIDLALEIDLLGEDSAKQKADQFFYLTRESFKRDKISELWKAKRATSPKSLAAAMLSDPVTDAIRKELRRNTGHKVEQSEIVNLLKSTVIKPECLEK